MDLRISDTFTASLARLTGDEQKQVKTTVFDLQVNPAAPGLSFHKLDRARDKAFWSVRVGRDIRLIVHRSDTSILVCYVDHHDKAYAWAERRKLEAHPTTGAAQLVEVRETVKEIVVQRVVEVDAPRAPKPPLFANVPEAQLLGYGVPSEWLSDVRTADEDALLKLAEHLPSEAAEALLELATGGKPAPAKVATSADPFAHPDAQRRFRLMRNVEELERALEYPWDRWTVFLHPAQRSWVEGDYSGPARISGSAGTGKTIVALHRAVFLARAYENARVLLTTFSGVLANALRTRLKRLISNEPRLAERLEVLSLDEIGSRLAKPHMAGQRIASREEVFALLQTAAAEVPHKFSASFLRSEWEHVVDAWQLDSWEAYKDVKRLGRKTRLSEAQRKTLWSIFERVRDRLDKESIVTPAGMFTKVAALIAKQTTPPFEHVVVDEAQDLGIPDLRLLAAIGGQRPNGLFFAGDLGQRIFQQPFSWKALGVDVRGRSRTLRVNYRTSHQIRTQADRLLAPSVADADGNAEDRSGTVSVFNGPVPATLVAADQPAETTAVAAWITKQATAGVAPHELALFVRSPAELDRARAAITAAGIPFNVLDDKVETVSGRASIGTMHLAKGLEFRAVAVMACDDGIVPLQDRIEGVTDESDLEDVYNTERHLLYVACTRARDFLHVSGTEPGSEFLDDFQRAAGRP